MMLYGSGVKLADGARGFIAQLIQIYTNTLGTWPYYLIAIAAFTTMFSTTLSCLDAYERVLKPTIDTIKNREEAEGIQVSYLYLILTAFGAVVILNIL